MVLSQPNPSLADLKTKLKRVWGYEGFRPPQQEVMQALLEQRDGLILMPTGGGKSLCFQLPALLQTGVTLVISPLVALMEDQVQDLQRRHLPAAVLHSELPSQQRRTVLRTLEHQTLRLLYLSPETLLSPPVWERLQRPELKINGLILDEAHCLAQWGNSFRPTYRRLGAVRPALLACRPPGTKMAISAFTATADPHTQATLEKVLQLKQPFQVKQSPYRSNLHLRVKTSWTPRCRREQLLQCIHAHGQDTGLVYVRSRRASQELAGWLGARGHRTAAYHAGLSPGERRQIEADWLQGRLSFVICTSAFGLGVNKRNCRWIVHFHAPLLLSEYLQEVGRGGRDGKVAEALMLVSEPTGWLDPDDQNRRRFFEQKVRSQHHKAWQLAQKLPRQGEVATISRQFRDGAIALALLHTQGYLEWIDPLHYQLVKPLPKRPSTPSLSSNLMGRYIRTRGCRWQFLLERFGFEEEGRGLRCGHCDNCCR